MKSNIDNKVESFTSTKYSTNFSEIGESAEQSNLDTSFDSHSNLKENNFRKVFSRKNRMLLFISLFLASLSINFDHGIIPAAIEEIGKSYGLQKDQIGFFGGLVYGGTAAGALVLSFVINKINRRKMLIFALISNGILVWSFTLSSNFYYLSLNRLVTGFVQALISIYIPVWIDQFGQSNYKTLFMTLFQLSSVSGLMIGYIMTMQTKEYFNSVIKII